MRSPFHGRTLEQSFSISTALLVLCVIGASIVVIENRVGATLRRSLEARGAAIAKSIGAVATPSLLAYNYAALQMASEGAAGNDGVVFVAIHDKEGVLAGLSGRAPAEAKVKDAMASLAASSRDVGGGRGASAPDRVGSRDMSKGYGGGGGGGFGGGSSGYSGSSARASSSRGSSSYGGGSRGGGGGGGGSRGSRGGGGGGGRRR